MTNMADSEGFVLLSTPRTGLKREFALMQAQSELYVSFSRSRTRKVQNGSFSNGVSEKSKRLKSFVCKEDLDKDLVNENDLVKSSEKQIINLIKCPKIEDVDFPLFKSRTNEDSRTCLVGISQAEKPVVIGSSNGGIRKASVDKTSLKYYTRRKFTATSGSSMLMGYICKVEDIVTDDVCKNEAILVDDVCKNEATLVDDVCKNEAILMDDVCKNEAILMDNASKNEDNEALASPEICKNGTGVIGDVRKNDVLVSADVSENDARVLRDDCQEEFLVRVTNEDCKNEPRLMGDDSEYEATVSTDACNNEDRVVAGVCGNGARVMGDGCENEISVLASDCNKEVRVKGVNRNNDALLSLSVRQDEANDDCNDEALVSEDVHKNEALVSEDVCNNYDDGKNEGICTNEVLVSEDLCKNDALVSEDVFENEARVMDHDDKSEALVPIDDCNNGTIVSTDGCKNQAKVCSDICRKTSTAEDEEITPGRASPLRTPSTNKLEMKMSKKISLTKFPFKMKELLETGMLEGLPVSYLYRGNKNGLKGKIKGCGILCSCSSCKGDSVVSPLQFERHAGSKNKRAADYIFLENGNSIRDVLNVCRDAPLDTLEETIKSAIFCSSPVKKVTVCKSCNGPLPTSRIMKTAVLCASCLEIKKSQARPVCTDTSDTRSSEPISTPKSSDVASNCISRQKKNSKGKLTRKDLRLHKLVFEEDGLPDGTELAYYNRGQKLLEGYKKGFGIFCHCCNAEVSPSLFEAHAGWASRRKPYLNIYTSNGVSLHELSVSLSKGRKFSANDNDDLCSICADFGDLLLCDACPRAFHRDCVGLSTVPTGKWYCQYCQLMYQRENFCKHNANAVAAGRVSGDDPVEQISKRCIRTVKTQDTEIGGCALCRSHDFSKSGFGPRTVLLCDQCEKEYHVGCLKDHKMADLRELPKGKWFCCTDCNTIHQTLQELLIRGPVKLGNSLSHVIKKKHVEECSNETGDLNVKWSLLNGKLATPESRLLLSKAVAIFHDRFDPIVDAKTGRDLIPSMVYGRNIRDQEFGGMYCAVLTANGGSRVVSAGILRIFGQEFAELPLVATSTDYQGRGYFQALFASIEKLLRSMNVKSLVLPSAEEAESIWTNKFGFKKVSQDKLIEYKNGGQMMIFQGTSLLEKPVPKNEIVENSPKTPNMGLLGKSDGI